MEDSKVPFSDTTARRAQLIAATERFKTSITDSVDDIKGDASELGKTAAFVGGVSLAVYLVVNALLPKSAEYRYAEKYGEPDEDDYDEYGELVVPAGRRKKEVQKAGALSGMVSGLLTTIVSNLARQQLTSFVDRIRENKALTSTVEPSSERQYGTRIPTEYTDHATNP